MNQTMNHHKITSINIFHWNMYHFQIFQKVPYMKNVPKGHNIDGICISTYCSLPMESTYPCNKKQGPIFSNFSLAIMITT
jgi:hypothetical protein